MQSIMRIAMALVIAFGVETTASAQFGGLKGLAKKAKKAFEKVEKTVKDVNDTKEKVSNQAETTVSEATGSEEVNSSSNAGSNTSAEPKKEIRYRANIYDYKLAKHTDWDYTSEVRDILCDMAYWCKRLRTSAETNDKSKLDMEALERLTTGRPSFEFMDEDFADAHTDMQTCKNWHAERREVVKAAIEVRDGVELPTSWDILSSTDEEKALKKELVEECRKAQMLKIYKNAAQMNRYDTAISGNDAWLTKLAKDNFPEWGKVLASKISTNYKVNYTPTKVPKSRYHAGIIMCEDQGYKVLHFIQLSQQYKGNGKYGDSEVRYGGMRWNDAVTLVK